MKNPCLGNQFSKATDFLKALLGTRIPLNVGRYSSLRLHHNRRGMFLLFETSAGINKTTGGNPSLFS
ncbi:MAG TPA: hypothetical protein V6D20_07565, partial [Candidatus Obscuribacterales bacterium]